MEQSEVNRLEWRNPENWGGPVWMSVYFSKKDTRTWVPKQVPWMGFTLNLAHTAGVAWLISIFLVVVALPFVALALA
jgi:uncharacterized membrane protein